MSVTHGIEGTACAEQALKEPRPRSAHVSVCVVPAIIIAEVMGAAVSMAGN
ncbi:MAG: hypothetical protein JWM52_491 [Candidatus Saccharibacteria bacterium]|nr:hypothetical protein [Candidatus Saccharibacteria bacterium]